MSDVNYLFKGRFFKVAQSREVIEDKNGGDSTIYYSITLTNGIKSFNVTAGENADITRCEMFKPYAMLFDIVQDARKTKIKVVAVQAEQTQNKGGDK